MGSKLAIARAYFAARRPRKLRRPIPETAVQGEKEWNAAFEKHNVLGVTMDEARAAATDELEHGTIRYPGYSFGLSSGTTGEPGVFLTSQAERDRWLGTILGKYLSLSQLLHLNAALLLKHNNQLYRVSSRVHYFDLGQSVAHWAPRLCDLQPTVLIGPPSVLLTLASSAALQRRPIAPHTVLCGGEPLFPQDRAHLQRAFGVLPKNLYQAKEGFLAAGCRHGGLHWNEDLMGLEGMRFKGTPDRVVPVITDFTRQSQSFQRYRIDDLLVLGSGCPCRTPFQKIATVEGRLVDVLLRTDAEGAYHPLFPLALNELLRQTGDYTVKQHDFEHITVECESTPRRDLLMEIEKALLNPKRLEFVPLRPNPPGQKRRRFQRLFDRENRIILDHLLEPLGLLT